MQRVVRRVVLVVLVVLVLVLVVAGAATWVFSDKIHSAALEVRHPEVSHDLDVVSVDGDGGGDRVLLDDRADHRAALHHGFRYGLRWDGGSAVVGGPAEEMGGHRLSLALLEGDRPVPGTDVDAFRELYDDPADVEGLALRRVRYDAGGHTLPAYLAEPTSPTRPGAAPGHWAVLVHGKGGTALEMARMARATVAAGRTTMLIGYRNDAGAWQDPSGEYAYGTTEWRDLHAALVWAHEHGAVDVVLGGASMGGGVIASYLERVPDHRGVLGVVLDSPMLDLDTVVSWGARDEELPGGLPLPEPLTWAAKRLAGLRFGLDWAATDHVDDTGWADVPVLVLHGDDDGTVPVSLSRTLAREDDDVRLEEFPGAGHVESWNSDPERYDRLVADFVGSVDRRAVEVP